MSAELPRVDVPDLEKRAREAPARQSRTLAPFGRRALTVTANEPLGAYRVLKVADTHGPAPQAGQFAMLAAAERWGAGEDERPYLPRAFSYARFQGDEAHFLLEDVGPGTRRLCELREGDELWMLGPLGQGFEAPAPDRGAMPGGDRCALLVGGGAGIAPLAILRDRLVSAGPAGSADRASGARPTVLLGFRDSAHAQGADLVVGRKLPDDANAANNNMLVATDDGSVGHHGLVTDLLREQLDRDAPSGAQAHATVYACGPPPMLEAVRALCAERSVPAQLALEAGMACGFGACYGCVVPKRGGGYLRVCVDGPVVEAARLDQVQGASDHRV